MKPRPATGRRLANGVVSVFATLFCDTRHGDLGLGHFRGGAPGPGRL